MQTPTVLHCHFSNEGLPRTSHNFLLPTKIPIMENEKGAYLVSLMPILVQNGFLGGEEIENMSLVSKVIYQKATEETIWSYFCRGIWLCDRADVVSTLGYRNMYWMWRDCQCLNLPHVEDRTEPFPPPSCEAKDIMLQICVYSNCLLSYTLNLSGEDLPTLLQHGCEDIEVAKLPASKVYSSSTNKVHPEVPGVNEDPNNTVTVRISMIRIDKMTITDLLGHCTTKDGFRYTEEYDTEDYDYVGEFSTFEDLEGLLYISPDTILGQLIGYHLWHRYDNNVGHFRQGAIAFRANVHFKHLGPGEDILDYVTIEMLNIVIEYKARSGYEVESVERFVDLKEEVTPFHILSELGTEAMELPTLEAMELPTFSI